MINAISGAFLPGPAAWRPLAHVDQIDMLDPTKRPASTQPVPRDHAV